MLHKWGTKFRTLNQAAFAWGWGALNNPFLKKCIEGMKVRYGYFMDILFNGTTHFEYETVLYDAWKSSLVVIWPLFFKQKTIARPIWSLEFIHVIIKHKLNFPKIPWPRLVLLTPNFLWLSKKIWRVKDSENKRAERKERKSQS